MWLFKSTPVNELCDKTVQFKKSNEEVSNKFNNTPMIIEKPVKVKQFCNLKENIVSLKEIQTKIGFLHKETRNKNRITAVIPYASSNDDSDNDNDALKRLEIFSKSIQKISKEISRLLSITEGQQCNEKKGYEQMPIAKSNHHTVTSDCLKLLDSDVVHESNLPPSQSTIIKPNNDEMKKEFQKRPSVNASKKSQNISNSKLKNESNTKFESTIISENTNTTKVGCKYDLNSVNENKKSTMENVLECFSNNIESALNTHFTAQKKERSEILDCLLKLKNTLITLIPHKSVEQAQNESNVQIENYQELCFIAGNCKLKDNCKSNVICSAKSHKSINQISTKDLYDNNNVCKNMCGVLRRCVCNKSVEQAQNESNVQIENNQELCLIAGNCKLPDKCKSNVICSAKSHRSINQISTKDLYDNNNVCKNMCGVLRGCVCNKSVEQAQNESNVQIENNQELCLIPGNCKLQDKCKSNVIHSAKSHKSIKNEATYTEIERPSQHIDHIKITLSELLSFLKNKEEEFKSLNVYPMTIENLQKNKSNENNNSSDCPKNLNCPSKNDDVYNNSIAGKSTNTMKLNVCEKNDICSFLHSQPIPEWITLLKKDIQINLKKEQFQETLNQPEQININSQHGKNIDQCKRITIQNPQTVNQCKSSNNNYSSQTINEFQKTTDFTDQCPKTSTNHCLKNIPNQCPIIPSSQYVKTADQSTSMNIEQHQNITNKSQKSNKLQQMTELIDQPPKTIDQCIQTSLSQTSNKNLQMTTHSLNGQKYANDKNSKKPGQLYIIANKNYKPDTQVWIPIRPK